MKFKLDQHGPLSNFLFEQLRDLFSEGQRCEDLAEGWLVRNTGGPRKFGSPEEALFGGISVVQFLGKPKPNAKEWRRIDVARDLYQATTDMRKELSKLPTVSKDRLRGLLDYGRYASPRGVNTVPSVIIAEDYALISVPDHVRGYEPVTGMVEILGSDYNVLYDYAEAERAQAKPTFTDH